MNSARTYLLTYDDYLDIRKAPHVRTAAPIISRGDLHEVSEFATVIVIGALVGLEIPFGSDGTVAAHRNGVCPATVHSACTFTDFQ